MCKIRTNGENPDHVCWVVKIYSEFLSYVDVIPNECRTLNLYTCRLSMASSSGGGGGGRGGGRDLFSPKTGSTISRLSGSAHNSPAEYISPSLRRNVNLTTPSVSTTLSSFTNINDDEAEKRERRRSKVLELQRRHHDIGSPATPDGGAGGDDRLVSVALFPSLGQLKFWFFRKSYAPWVKRFLVLGTNKDQFSI